jgi:DNA-binding response OmpR family regulator
MHILVVEDDDKIASLIQLYLEKEHYRVSLARNGTEGITQFRQGNPDLVVLDLMLPEVDGWSVLKAIRNSSSTPVILLTAKSDEFDKVMGLESGADDYLTKPFSPRELLARIKAILRRSSPHKEFENNRTITYKDLSLDPRKMEVRQNEQVIKFSALEFKLLYFLSLHPGYVFSRTQLMDEIYADQDVLVEERTIDVHIKNIRKKLGDSSKNPHYIESVFSVGYRFLEP